MVALGTEEFFRTLYGEEAPGFLPIFTHTPNRTQWVSCRLPRGGREDRRAERTGA